jgi:hypothetical protein
MTSSAYTPQAFAFHEEVECMLEAHLEEIEGVMTQVWSQILNFFKS